MSDRLNELIDMVRDYATEFPAERTTASAFFHLLESWPRSLYRDHMPGHLTASAWVLSPDRTEVLLLHHRKLGKWLQPGGHADGDEDLVAVARRELEEETGLNVDDVARSIFDLDIHDIPAFGDVPGHQHFDARFLMIAGSRDAPQRNDESHAVRWHHLTRIEELTEEESIRRMVAKSYSEPRSTE
ncbi:MAG: NUDIX hydrolase [Spirochaeta sp.]|nr:NUDIX hydrolase [Spirochaeta sp.]